MHGLQSLPLIREPLLVITQDTFSFQLCIFARELVALEQQNFFVPHQLRFLLSDLSLSVRDEGLLNGLDFKFHRLVKVLQLVLLSFLQALRNNAKLELLFLLVEHELLLTLLVIKA